MMQPLLLLLLPLLVVSNAELNLKNGIALARSEKWLESENVLTAGFRMAPHDKRFPQEIAAVRFKQNDLAGAEYFLQKAYSIDPDDPYTIKFLASVYFLQDNLETALKYWNRVGMPYVEAILEKPKPRINDILLDRSYAFSPYAVLKASDYQKTKFLLGRLNVFTGFEIRLMPNERGKFDLNLYTRERSHWSDAKIPWLVSTLRDIPYETLHLDWNNWNGKAINLSSLLRWDSDKRRLFFSVSAPVNNSPSTLFQFRADYRDELWNIAPNLIDHSEEAGEFKMNEWRITPSINRAFGDQTEWQTDFELASRRYTGVNELLSKENSFVSGYSLSIRSGLNGVLSNIPEKRFRSNVSVSASLGKVFSEPNPLFAQVDGSLSMNWSTRSDDGGLKIRSVLRAGSSLGTVPFDQLYSIGIDRDTDLWIRGHKVNDKKGNNPLADHYLLWNSDLQMRVWHNVFIDYFAGPFLDVAQTWNHEDSLFQAGSFVDAGVVSKFRILKGPTLSVSYGWDLIHGGNVLYIYLGRF